MHRSCEDKLVLECAQIFIDAASATRIAALLRESLNWTHVWDCASRNAVLSLLVYNLKRQFESLLPENIVEACSEAAGKLTKQNLQLTQKLLEIVELLESNGVEVLPFKGPTLALRAYKNLAMRQFVDLDILVKKSQINRAVEILRANNFKLPNGETRFTTNDWLATRKKDIGLISADGAVKLEMHWKLSGSHFALPIQMDFLWNNLDEVTLAGKTIKTLAFNDLMIYLCLHGARHGWERLGWLCDIAALVQTEPEIDWRALEFEAKQLGCERVLALALLLIYELWRIETPTLAHKRLTEDAVLKKIANQVIARLFQAETVSNELTEWYLYHLKLKENQLDRWKLHLHYSYRYARSALVANEADQQAFNLPDYLSALYVVLRPLRLIYERLPKSGSGAQKDKLPQR